MPLRSEHESLFWRNFGLPSEQLIGLGDIGSRVLHVGGNGGLVVDDGRFSQMLFQGVDHVIDGDRCVASAEVDDFIAERLERGDGAAGDVVDVGEIASRRAIAEEGDRLSVVRCPLSEVGRRADLSPAQAEGGIPFHVFEDHDAERVWRFEIEDQMRESPERVTAVAPLGEVEGKAPRMGLDFSNRGSELSLKAVSDMRSGFVVVIIDDFVEILLNQRVEGEAASHRSQRFFTPRQNSASVSGRTLPEAISSSRRAASASVSSGDDVGAVLRSSSTASLSLERAGNCRASFWISAVLIMK